MGQYFDTVDMKTFLGQLWKELGTASDAVWKRTFWDSFGYYMYKGLGYFELAQIWILYVIKTFLGQFWIPYGMWTFLGQLWRDFRIETQFGLKTIWVRETVWNITLYILP